MALAQVWGLLAPGRGTGNRPFVTAAQLKRLSKQFEGLQLGAQAYTLYSLKRGGLQWLYYEQRASLDYLHALSGIKTREVLMRYLDPTAHMPL